MILESEEEKKKMMEMCDLALRGLGLKIYPLVDFLLKNSRVETPKQEDQKKEE